MPTQREIVEAYVALWCECDAAARTKLLDFCWSDEGAIHIADRVMVGRKAVEKEIARFCAESPGDRPLLTSDITFVDRWFRFSAEVRRPDGSAYSRMVDFGELGPDGRIRLIVTFVEDERKGIGT